MSETGTSNLMAFRPGLDLDTALLLFLAIVGSSVTLFALDYILRYAFDIFCLIFTGVGKFLRYSYMTYTMFWNFFYFMVKLCICFIIAAIMFYFFVEEQTRTAFVYHVSKVAPITNMVLEKAISQIVVINDMQKLYWKVKTA